MNTKVTMTEMLAVWIAGIKETAKLDMADTHTKIPEATIYWFGPTINKPFSIVAGWKKMFKEDFSDIFCCSKSQPEYVMCVKVVVNNGPCNTDFESMPTPVCGESELDDTCIPLEWDDDPKIAAMFFEHEWERIMKEHKEDI